MASLLVVDGPAKGNTFALGDFKLIMVGRDHSCTFQILDPRLSRMHLQIKLLEESRGHAVIDFQSSNGVYVNGNRITGETPLASGDVIRAGESSLVYSTEDNPPPTSQEELLLRARRAAMTTELGQ
jgi:pSer/pThr/pTyr-binding forkhead associated (FHA) protein